MKLAYCHCVESVLGCLLEREVAAAGGGAAVCEEAKSVVVVEAIGVWGWLGVAKAGARTIE